MGLVAVIDLETTGVNSWRHDRIIEVGAVVFNQNGTWIRECTTLVNPERDVGPSNVHGLQAGDLLQAP